MQAMYIQSQSRYVQWTIPIAFGISRPDDCIRSITLYTQIGITIDKLERWPYCRYSLTGFTALLKYTHAHVMYVCMGFRYCCQLLYVLVCR